MRQRACRSGPPIGPRHPQGGPDDLDLDGGPPVCGASSGHTATSRHRQTRVLPTGGRVLECTLRPAAHVSGAAVAIHL
eukprot:10937694-Alexandrium_andersonii.AAC.1